MRKILTLFTLLAFTISSFSYEYIYTMAKKPQKQASKKTRKYSEGRGAFLSISGGYGIPFLKTGLRSPLKEIGDKDWYQRNGDLSVKPIFGTNGAGFAANISGGIMFNKTLGFDATLTLAWHPEVLDARIDITNYYATQKSATFAMYLSPHIMFHWDNNKRFGLTAKLGPCIPFFSSVDSRVYILDKQGRLIETLAGLPIIPLNTNNIPILNQIPNLANLEIELVSRSHTVFNPTIGISTSLAADIKLNKNFTLFAEIRVQAYTVNAKETIFDEFKQTGIIRVLGAPIPVPDGLLPFPSNINSVEEAPEYLRHIVYKKELTEESNTARYGTKSFFANNGDLLGTILNPSNAPLIDPDQPMEEVRPKINGSTLYFNAGFRINFPSKKVNNSSVDKSVKSPKTKKSKKSTSTTFDDPDTGVLPE